MDAREGVAVIEFSWDELKALSGKILQPSLATNLISTKEIQWNTSNPELSW
jgi:hypothetical protein